MELTVRDRQSLLDIAVQYLGGVEGVFSLSARNGIEVTDRLDDGQLLEWENGDVVVAAVRTAFSLRGIISATDIDERDYQELLAATSTKAAVSAVQASVAGPATGGRHRNRQDNGGRQGPAGRQTGGKRQRRPAPLWRNSWANWAART